jgi:glyoxalase family protein
MHDRIAGIHHVTAIATDPQRNVDFYSGTLGLRLVKKTVNFDDPGTYHFYFGDESGMPGTILTFFPWPLARRGSRGAGQATVTSFAVPERSLGFWRERLVAAGVVTEEVTKRFDEESIAFYDPDGLKLELVAGPTSSAAQPWGGAEVSEEHAIRGFHSVTLTLNDAETTASLLTDVMGLELEGEEDNRIRLRGSAPLGARVDLLHSPQTGFGRVAAGTVHHVAWRVPDVEAQEAWRNTIAGAGLHPTGILDRQYFESIYFREPGGVLFELATDPPGFTRDEAPTELGTSLKLPPWLEDSRERIEQALPGISVPETAAAGRS